MSVPPNTIVNPIPKPFLHKFIRGIHYLSVIASALARRVKLPCRPLMWRKCDRTLNVAIKHLRDAGAHWIRVGVIAATKMPRKGQKKWFHNHQAGWRCLQDRYNSPPCPYFLRSGIPAVLGLQGLLFEMWTVGNREDVSNISSKHDAVVCLDIKIRVREFHSPWTFEHSRVKHVSDRYLPR